MRTVTVASAIENNNDDDDNNKTTPAATSQLPKEITTMAEESFIHFSAQPRLPPVQVSAEGSWWASPSLLSLSGQVLTVKTQRMRSCGKGSRHRKFTNSKAYSYVCVVQINHSGTQEAQF